MIWHTIEFIWRETLLQLRRERLIGIATVSTVAVLLVLLGANLLFLFDLRLWTSDVASQVQVSAYFAKDFPRAQAETAASTVGRWPEVRTARFISREEGWEEQKRRTAIFRTAERQGFGPEVLPDSVRVWVREPAQVPAVAKKLEKLEGVNDVIPSTAKPGRAGQYARAVVRFQHAVTWTGLILGVLVALAGMMIVHNTVRLALHSRWREIYIMQLVGATRSVIAAPFMLEGAIHGALGAAAAVCLLVPAHMYLRAIASSSSAWFRLQPDLEVIRFAVCLILGGALLGLTGSAMSVRRFLSHKPEWQL
jgi:cell division transport system permease protein